MYLKATRLQTDRALYYYSFHSGSLHKSKVDTRHEPNIYFVGLDIKTI